MCASGTGVITAHFARSSCRTFRTSVPTNLRQKGTAAPYGLVLGRVEASGSDRSRPWRHRTLGR